MANKSTGIGIGIGIAAAGLLGYAVSRLITDARKKSASAAPAGIKAKAEPDTRPKDIACPSCGAPVREYEFFCPACRGPMEQKTDGGTDAGARNNSGEEKQ
ncbi:MAG: hypothetical protein WCX65_02900 [bacterium]